VQDLGETSLHLTTATTPAASALAQEYALVAWGAEVVLADQARIALLAAVANPADADRVSHLQAGDARAHLAYHPGALVTGHHRVG
jgi:hypothetical protein